MIRITLVGPMLTVPLEYTSTDIGWIRDWNADSYPLQVRDGEALTVEAVEQEARDEFIQAWMRAGGSMDIIGARDEY